MFNLKLRKKPVEQNSEHEDQEHSDDVPMPLTSHLGELRRRIVRVIIVIFVVFVGATVIEMELDQPYFISLSIAIRFAKHSTGFYSVN